MRRNSRRYSSSTIACNSPNRASHVPRARLRDPAEQVIRLLAEAELHRREPDVSREHRVPGILLDERPQALEHVARRPVYAPGCRDHVVLDLVRAQRLEKIGREVPRTTQLGRERLGRHRGHRRRQLIDRGLVRRRELQLHVRAPRELVERRLASTASGLQSETSCASRPPWASPPASRSLRTHRRR